MNKASGGDRISVELFQILKDNAMKVLHSILSELWELVMDREAWHAAIHGVTKSRTRLSN